jgi:bifunctional non-homologous end joining protein LigD
MPRPDNRPLSRSQGTSRARVAAVGADSARISMLEDYGKKRRFDRTSEPRPRPSSRSRQGERGDRAGSPLTFVVQKHAARRLHYDFRLEVDGVLKSWSVPKGPSLDPEEKRLAVMVEDHPLDYASFEGVIPKGEYGAGQVIVWDSGTYSPDEGGDLCFRDRAAAEERTRRGLAGGKLSLFLRGGKLTGSWALVKMSRGDNEWLLFKHRDEHANGDRDILAEDRSVISGLAIEDIRAGHLPRRPASPDQRPAGPRSGAEGLPGARRAPFPDSVSPMLATLTDAPFSDSDWLFEPKLDGVRAVALVRDGSVRLHSRRGLDVTRLYPSLTEDLRRQPERELVLDGEIVAPDEQGRPSFERLQRRLNLSREADIRRAEAQVPILYYAFDLLYLDGYDVRGATVQQRRGLLQRLVLPSDRVRVLEYFEEDGEAAHEAALSHGLEGIIAKRRDSPYESGRRSRHWLKVKATRNDEFVIAGYTAGDGSRADTFGALLLGYYDDDGRLLFASHVGSGFDDRTLADLRKRLDGIRTDDCAFLEPPPLNAPATWVRPELVAEVKFAQWTEDGRLRAPVFLRLRDDKSPNEVRRSEVVPAPAPRAAPAEPPSNTLGAQVNEVLEQLGERKERLTLSVQGHEVPLNNLDKEFWPAREGRRDLPEGRRALTKRDLIVYLATVSPYLLPHLRDRPLTLTRYPDGIIAEHFYQKHWDNPLPPFVETVRLFSEHNEGDQEYLLCNNLATLLWLGQLSDLELHTWYSRVSPDPDGQHLSSRFTGSRRNIDNSLLNYPDFIVFDLDPYIYSGREAAGDEPELNRKGFAKTCQAALWLKELLDSLSLSSFVKTSGRTGLHVYVPILRQIDYDAVRSACRTICDFLLRQHPRELTMEWSVEKRAGKVFLDHNQNARGKTLASVYSPRPLPEAAVSMPLRWDELGEIYPADFTILSAHDRLAQVGDLWAGILDAKHDLQALLEMAAAREA